MQMNALSDGINNNTNITKQQFFNKTEYNKFYPLIAPSFSPDIKNFCVNIKKINIGITDIMAPEAMRRQFDENIPLKSFKPTGNV